MARLTVRNLDDDVVRRLRIRAAEHGRSAEAEHREILRLVLMEEENLRAERQKIAQRLAEFRQRTGGRDTILAADLLGAVRTERLETLARTSKDG